MRGQLICSIIFLMCVAFLQAPVVEAQSTRRFVVEIPFEFMVAGRQLPPGKYEIKRIDPTKPNLVLVKNTENGLFRLFLSQRVTTETPQTEYSVIFKKRGEEYYLFQLWTLGYNDGNQVLASWEKEKIVQRNDSAIVKLNLKIRTNNKKP